MLGHSSREETQRSIPHDQFGSDRQATTLQLTQSVQLRVFAFAKAGLHRQQLFLAQLRDTDYHQQASLVVFQLHVRINAIGPGINIFLADQRPFGALVTLALPDHPEP